MDLQKALAAIKALEGGAELASAIESHVSGLDQKNYTLIGEKRAETAKRQTMQSALEGIGKSLGIEGDVEAVISSAQGKIQTLTSDRDAAVTAKTELETKVTEAESKVTAFERKTKFSDAAAKSGANAAVLEKLFGDKIDDLTIANDGTVKIGDKPLKDYVEADDGLKPFLTALFPDGKNDTTSAKKKTDLPGGPPSDGSNDKGTDPLSQHLARHRGGATALMTKTK